MRFPAKVGTRPGEVGRVAMKLPQSATKTKTDSSLSITR